MKKLMKVLFFGFVCNVVFVEATITEVVVMFCKRLNKVAYIFNDWHRPGVYENGVSYKRVIDMIKYLDSRYRMGEMHVYAERLPCELHKEWKYLEGLEETFKDECKSLGIPWTIIPFAEGTLSKLVDMDLKKSLVEAFDPRSDMLLSGKCFDVYTMGAWLSKQEGLNKKFEDQNKKIQNEAKKIFYTRAPLELHDLMSPGKSSITPDDLVKIVNSGKNFAKAFVSQSAKKCGMPELNDIWGSALERIDREHAHVLKCINKGEGFDPMLPTHGTIEFGIIGKMYEKNSSRVSVVAVGAVHGKNLEQYLMKLGWEKVKTA